MNIRVLHIVRNPIVVKLFLRPLIAGERRRGHQVEVACGPDGSSYGDFGVPVHDYRIERSLRPTMLISSIRKLAKIIREGEYDIVMAHMVLGGAAGRIARAIAGQPGKIIYASHGLPCYKTRPLIKYFPALWYEMLMRKWTDAVIVLNRYDYDLASRNNLAGKNGEIYLLPSVGIDHGTISAAAAQVDSAAYLKELGVDNEAPTVCYLGRFIAAKGIKLFLKIARRYLASEKPVNFLIAGYGPLEKYVRRFIRRYNLEDWVRVIGWHEDNIGLLAASDILCLPTLYEGSPVVIQEAMASGTAVLASRIPGPEDLLEDGVTGLLASPDDLDEFVRKLALLANNQELRDGLESAARKQALEFDLTRCVDQWTDIIENVASL